MVDKKKIKPHSDPVKNQDAIPESKSPPKPDPIPVPAPAPNQPDEDSEDILSQIDEATWKNGFYVKVRKHQFAVKGLLFSWQSERITSDELVSQSLSEVLDSKWGAGLFRLHFFHSDDRKMFVGKKIEIAVGELNDQRPTHSNQPTQVNPPADFRRGPVPPIKNSQEKVADRPDVQDAKAKVEMAKAELDLLEVEQKKKTLSSGNENNQVTDLKFQMMTQSIDAKFDKMLAALKPSGDTNPQITALMNEVAELKKKTETNSILNFMSESNKQNIQIMQDSNKTLVETIRQNKSKGGIEDLKETLESLGLVRKWKKEDREDEWEERSRFMPQDMPQEEKLSWLGVANKIADVIQDLNKDGLLTQKLADMKDPPVQPQLGKVYTREEEDAIIKREVDEAVEKYKKSLPPESVTGPGTVAVIPARESAPDANQVIPAGETPEEFAAKKKVMNAMLSLLAEEMVLCPRECDWINFALGKLPDDILIAFRDAVEAPGVFAVLEKYADINLITEIKTRISAEANDKDKPEKKKAVWFATGFNILKAEITELLKPPAPNTVISTAIPAGGAGGTTSTGVPAGTTNAGVPSGTVTQ